MGRNFKTYTIQFTINSTALGETFSHPRGSLLKAQSEPHPKKSAIKTVL